MADYTVCKYCTALYGLKGSEAKERSFETDEEFAEHLENTHGIPVQREGESEEETMARCAAKGIVPDRTKCVCRQCRELRGEKVAG